MRNLLIFLLIAFVTSETDNFFYEFNYNSIYEVDTSKFPSGYIPIGNLYFTIPVEDLEDKTILQILLFKGDKIDFKVKVSGFYQHPTESEIVDGTDNIELDPIEVSTRENYILYTFKMPTLKKQEKIKYLVYTILNNANLSYLSLFTYSYSMQEFTIYNVNYKKEEILNKTTLSHHKGIFIFILENEELETNKIIRLKLNKELSDGFKLGSAGFKKRPTKEEDLYNEDVSEPLKLKSVSKEDNYYIYEFPVENQEINKQNYLGIAVSTTDSLDYISFYIGPEL